MPGIPSPVLPSRPVANVLLVDDDRRLCGFLTRLLSREGYATRSAYDGSGMRRALADGSYDLVILDLSFPQGDDGLTLARGLRAQTDTPMIMLSGKGATIDKVVGLELGADDYVTKPFEPRELIARIRTVLRRTGSQIVSGPGEELDGEALLSFSGWQLDLTRYELSCPAGQKVELTTLEFRLLSALVRRPGRVLSREQILDIVARRHWNPYDRSIDVLIGKLRRKLGDDPRSPRFIKTVRGVGYVFTPDEAVQ